MIIRLHDTHLSRFFKILRKENFLNFAKILFVHTGFPWGALFNYTAHHTTDNITTSDEIWFSNIFITFETY